MYNAASVYKHKILLAAISVLLFAFSAVAQTESARIQGAVTDQAGAAIPGATVTVTDLGTKREVTAQSDDEGNFSVLSLQPGKYQISVSQTNFKTSKQDITLEVAQNAKLDFSLEAGAVTETVTITSDVPLVDATSSSLGAVVQGRQIVELPLNGRNVLELARLTPGVTQGVVGGLLRVRVATRKPIAAATPAARRFPSTGSGHRRTTFCLTASITMNRWSIPSISFRRPIRFRSFAYRPASRRLNSGAAAARSSTAS